MSGHHHAWEMTNAGVAFVGTWADYDGMDAALDALTVDEDPDNPRCFVDNVDPCDCAYGVGAGEPKDE